MEPYASSHPTPKKTAATVRSLQYDAEEVIDRLQHLYSLTKDANLLKMVKAFKVREVPLDEINNQLMALFRDYSLVEAYSLLYELNYKRFMLVIFNKIKYYGHLLDPKDILQDVFLSVYRYPSRFREDKKHAFRNWTYSIIRNTIFKHLKMRDSSEYSSDVLTEIAEDKRASSPLTTLVNTESVKRFKNLYLLYLILYLNVVNNFLSPRERLALQLVEVEDKRYREAAEILGIKLENFKMVVCRARKKILKQMNRLLGEE